MREHLRSLPGYTVLRSCRRLLDQAKYICKVPMVWFWCVSQGVQWRYGWRLFGRPVFRLRGANTRILIGERFCAHSKSDRNAIGVFQPVIITAWGGGALVEIADDVGLSGCSILAQEHVVIGSRVMVGVGALIMDTNAHALDPVERIRHGRPVTAPVFIEDDVFIGAHSIILKGVRIGKAAVVAAGAVVTRDVPPGCIVGGNPAKIIGSVPQS